MSEITIIKGEEFKIAVKKEIKRDDIFISEYSSFFGYIFYNWIWSLCAIAVLLVCGGRF